MNKFPAAGVQPHLTALSKARDVLTNPDLGCIESVNTAWQLLKDVCVEELPASLQGDWSAVSERATNLANLGSGSLGLSVSDEAGDIGSIILFLGWLMQPDLSSAVAPSFFGEPALIQSLWQ